MHFGEQILVISHESNDSFGRISPQKLVFYPQIAPFADILRHQNLLAFLVRRRIFSLRRFT
jgi:hypothetical protein